MKAIVYHGNQDVRYEDFPEPARLAPGEVRVQVKYAGMCHTDYNEYRNGPIFVAAKPHPRTGRSLPLVLGHEFAGEVVEVGSGVTHVKTGDAVAVNAVDGCRECVPCRMGRSALCVTAAYIGFARDGGFAEYAAVPGTCCHRLGPGVSYRAGALVEPLSVALHAVRQADVALGSRVAVVGGGTVGLCVLQVLRACGAREVLMVEKSESKRELATLQGASTFLNPERDDVPQEIAARTEGLGADVTFECVGSAAALRAAIEVTRPAGTVCIVGIYPGAFPFDWNVVLAQEKKLVTSLAYADEFPMVIAMLGDGRLKAEPLITRVIPLANAVELGLARFEDGTGTNIKTLVNIGQ